MATLSVIVTACDCAAYLPAALDSAWAAQRRLAAERPDAVEVLVVDDGSADGSAELAEPACTGRPGWRLVRRHERSSPACARNTGAALSQGELLFFLDGDDLFLPGHLLACARALDDPAVDFVKTGARLADPVHAGWRTRIEHSLVLNLCVRRAAHRAVGGLPDYHLFAREGDDFRHELDVFYKLEDQFYNEALARRRRGARVAEETVEYRRRPGNAYDRQYDKFCRPPGAVADAHTAEERLRLRLAECLAQERLCRPDAGDGAAGHDELVGQARQALARGQAEPAERLAQRAIQLSPSSAGAWGALADACRQQGKAGPALEAARRLARLAPGGPEAQQRLALALAEAGLAGEAEACLRELLGRWPGHAEAALQLGVLLAQSQRLAEGLAWLGRAVEAAPGHAPARHNLGVAQAQAGRPEEAAAQLEEALRLEPGYAEALFNLGTVQGALGRAALAEASLRRALELRPDHFGAMNNLGLALQGSGRPGEAAVLLRQAARLRPAAEEAHNNLGLALAELGRFGEAERAYGEALRLRPGYADAHANLGCALKEQGRVEEALACFEMALRLAPGSASARYNRALTLLQAGRWAEGWPEYEHRWGRGKERERHAGRPRWGGEPPEGKAVLAWAEQGLGDAIQFARYAQVLKARGARVVLECPPPLAALLRGCAGADEVVAEGAPLPPFDAQAPLMSLPGLCGTTPEHVPGRVPYLRAEPARVARWRAWLGPGPFRVGVSWQGNPRFAGDRWRSAPLAALAPLAAVPGVELVSLQRGPGAEQLAAWDGQFAVRGLPGEADQDGAFLDTAAVAACLDLVVCADSAVGHLAGALGVPAWLALSAAADWRWGREGETTPWYPGHRLFRQARLGDWGGVFARMAERLAGEIAGRARRGLARVEMAAGEAADRWTILRIKGRRLADPAKLAHVRRELEALGRALPEGLGGPEGAGGLVGELEEVNARLWEVEDGLRGCERAGDFGARFVELARSVYRLNDERGELKRRISAALGAPWADQKQYG